MFGCLVLNLLKFRDTIIVLHSFTTVDVISLKLSRIIWICDNSKCSLGQRSTNFWSRLHLACNAFCFSRLYNRFAHVKRYTQSKRHFYILQETVPRTLQIASSEVSLQSKGPLVLYSLPLPCAFYKLVDLDVIAAQHFNNRDWDIHASALYAPVSTKQMY